MRRRIASIGRAPVSTVGERLLLLAIRELEDEDRPATRRIADRFLGRLLDLCESLFLLEHGHGTAAAARHSAAAHVEQARWSLQFLRTCGALTPDIQRRIAAGLDVVARRIGGPSIALPASRGDT